MEPSPPLFLFLVWKSQLWQFCMAPLIMFKRSHHPGPRGVLCSFPNLLGDGAPPTEMETNQNRWGEMNKKWNWDENQLSQKRWGDMKLKWKPTEMGWSQNRWKEMKWKWKATGMATNWNGNQLEWYRVKIDEERWNQNGNWLKWSQNRWGEMITKRMMIAND